MMDKWLTSLKYEEFIKLIRKILKPSINKRVKGTKRQLNEQIQMDNKHKKTVQLHE